MLGVLRLSALDSLPDLWQDVDPNAVFEFSWFEAGDFLCVDVFGAFND
jgi:hypothetical protein